MVRSLVVHIGDHKTGSTAIQRALGSGAVRPEGIGLCYPRAGRDNHNALAKAMQAGRGAEAEAALARLAGVMARSDAAVGVLSAEEFEGVPPARLHEGLSRHFPGLMDDLRIVAYVRPHAERVLSSFAEQTKIGAFAGTLEEFHRHTLARRRFFYAPRFAAWRATFGPRFVLRPMIRSELRDGDVVRDFLHLVLRGAPFGLRPMPRANPSLPVEDLAVLRALQMALSGLPQPRRHAAGWRMAGLLTEAPAPRATPLALHAALAAEIVAAYRADAAALDAAFFAGTPMTAALEAAPAGAVPAPQSIALEDHFSAEAARLIAAFARLAAATAAAPGGSPAPPPPAAGGTPA